MESIVKSLDEHYGTPMTNMQCNSIVHQSNSIDLNGSSKFINNFSINCKRTTRGLRKNVVVLM